MLPPDFAQQCDRLLGQTRNPTLEANEQLIAKSGIPVLCVKGERTLSSSMSACGTARRKSIAQMAFEPAPIAQLQQPAHSEAVCQVV